MPFPFSIIYKGLAFHDFVWIRRDIYKDLLTDSPSHENIGLFLHEQEHYKRIRKYGKWKFGWRFYFDRKFRFEEEIAANKPQMKYLKENGEDFDIKKRARHLSGIIYRFCVSKKEAEKRLKQIWSEL